MIGLMDCNNFFVSCERLFRPDLQKKPVAVLSSNDGCIVARSQEVKDLGVPMGIPYFQIQELCKKEHVTLFSSNFPLYRDISTRVMAALKSEYDTCEIYSVDEAFFEVPEGTTENDILNVRKRIMQKTGIPVSFGVGETKTLVKIANGIAKKGNGVFFLNATNRNQIVSELSCGSVWGVGRQTSAQLTKMSIVTVADLLAQDKALIQRTFGVTGERLLLELQGVSVYKIGESFGEGRESYMSTRSFSKPVMDKLTLMSALGHHVAHVAEKMRQDSCVARTITIITRGSRYGEFSHRVGTLKTSLLTPTNDTFVLTKEVSKLLDELFDSEVPYKKAGVVMGGIEPEGVTGHSLFDEYEENKNTKVLNAVTDTINGRFGAGTVRHAVTLGAEKWKERKKLKSPEYTTQWSEILSIKAK